MFELNIPNTPLEEQRIPFGKYAGTLVSEIPPGYFKWFIGKYDAGTLSGGSVLYWLDANIDALREMIDGKQLALVEADTEEYTLSPSQLDASTHLTEAFLNGTQFGRLEGGAGYGKSFCVKDIVRNLILSKQFTVKAAAVSYVATEVLRGQLDQYDVPCMTLARAIGLDKEYDGPRELYVMGDRTPEALATLFAGGTKRTLLVLDEYSMVNDEYACALGDAARQYNGAILVVGDLMQLPPVNQDTDCKFSTIPDAAELTDPMRYSKESDLYKVEQAVRAWPEAAMSSIGIIAHASDEVMLYDTSDDLLDAFKRTCSEFPHDDNRMLFFRRADVIKANNAVRKVLFGDDPAPLEPGERLLVVRTSDLNETRYYTGTTLDVIEVEQSDQGTLYATLGSGARVPIMFAISEHKADPDQSGGKWFNDETKRLADEANDAEGLGVSRAEAWAPYREHKDSFVFVAYNYATTVHKAQGATVDRIFVSPRGLLGVRGMGDKLAYVALTRAKKEVHVS